MKNIRTVEDLVINSEFREWVLNPNASANIFWKKWLKNHPEKEDSFKEAVRLVQLMGRINYEPDTQFAENIWEKIESRIARVKTKDREVVPLNIHSVVKQNKNSSGSKKFNYWILSLAATVVLLLATIAMLVIEEDRFYDQREENVAIVKSNPKGQKSTIMLPDGTMVIMNAASSLSYTNDYNVNERRVKLDGEAFFDVTENAKKPFIVETTNLITTALGTTFNINAHLNRKEEVTLVTGKIRIENQNQKTNQEILSPGEMLKFTEEGELVKSTVTSFDHLGWKDGIIVFIDTPLNQAVEELEKWYGVEIDLQNYPDDLNMNFTGTFANDNLSNVLQSLSYTIPFDFKIEDKKVIVNFNK